MISRKIGKLIARPYVATLIGLNIGMLAIVIMATVPSPDTISVYTNSPSNDIAVNSNSFDRSDMPSWGDKVDRISIRNPGPGGMITIPEPNVDNLMTFSTAEPSTEDKNQIARYLRFCNGSIRVTWITRSSKTAGARLVATRKVAHSTMLEVELPQQIITDIFGLQDFSCKRTLIVDSSGMVILGNYLAISEIDICQILSNLLGP